MLNISKKAKKFLDHLDPNKQYKQINSKVLELQDNPKPQDYKHVSGYPGLFRVTSGEYRILYKTEGTVTLIIDIGKRNDDEIYKKLNKQ